MFQIGNLRWLKHVFFLFFFFAIFYFYAKGEINFTKLQSILLEFGNKK